MAATVMKPLQERFSFLVGKSDWIILKVAIVLHVI